MNSPMVAGSPSRVTLRPALRIKAPTLSAIESRIGVAILVAISTCLRGAAAVAHTTPKLFPDEYIYSALGRSLGSSGRPVIRGSTAHFPALLEPLVAAPLWALASTPTAYHLVQVENAFFMSLAAIPVYLLARRLELDARYALFCAAFAVATPDLAFSGRVLADPLAYPLALSAIYAAVVAIQRPSRRSQLAFLLLALLATLARVQYVVLLPAFLCTVFVTGRRAAFATHRLTLLVIGGGTAAALVAGTSRVLGYYAAVVHLHVGAQALRWMTVDLFLLAVTSGVALVPGALVGLVSARGKAQAPFGIFVGFYSAAVLTAASLYASNGSGRFQERYLFTLLPLIPLAFGLYLRQGRPLRWFAVGCAAALALASSREPLSGYAAAFGSTDSPLLWAVQRLNELAGSGLSSLVFAGYAAFGALTAIAVALGVRARVSFVATLLFLVAVSVGATWFDITNTQKTAARLLPPTPSWVDAANVGPVTAIGTRLADPALLVEQLFWNTSIAHEAVLPGGTPTDAFAHSDVQITRSGVLTGQKGPLRSPILFEQFGATAAFRDATLVGETPSFALWKPNGAARLAMLEEGRYHDGWLAPAGSLRLWATPGHHLDGVVTVGLSLPAHGKPSKLVFGGRTVTVLPGQRRRLRFCVAARTEWKLDFRAAVNSFVGIRSVSVRQTTPRYVAGVACSSGSHP